MKTRIRSFLLPAVSLVLLLLPILSPMQSSADVCYDSTCGSTNPTLFGQTQSYDVLLRGNSEAVVNARIDVQNNDTKPLTQLSYSVTSGQLENITAFQEVACNDLPIIHPLGAAAQSTSNTSNQVSPAAAGTVSSAIPPASTVTSTDFPPCYQALAEHPLNSSNPLLYYYPSTDYLYQKVTVHTSGNSFSLVFPQPVTNNMSTTLVMAYSLSGVSHKSLGAYHYNFKTLKIGAPVSNVTVGVSVDENYILAGAAKANINYRPAATSDALGMNVQSGIAQSASGASSTAINNYVSGIGTNGAITEHAASLASGETFAVTGRFASSTFLLNWPRTMLRYAIFIFVIAALVLWYLKNRRRLQKHHMEILDKPAEKDNSNEDKQVSEEHVDIEENEESYVVKSQTSDTPHFNMKAMPFYGLVTIMINKFRERRVRPVYFAIFCGLLTVLFLAIASVGYSVLSNVGGLLFFPSGLNSYFVPGLFIGVILVSIFGFVLLTVVLPVAYMGSFKRAVRTFVQLLIFFVIAGIVLIAIEVQVNNSAANNPCSNAYTGSASCTTSINPVITNSAKASSN